MNPRTEQDPVTREIVTILKKRAAEHGYSFRALEDRSGVSKTKLQAIFAGERHLYLSDLEMLCDALDLVSWTVMRDAKAAADLSAASPILEGPDEYGLAAHTGDKETDQ